MGWEWRFAARGAAPYEGALPGRLQRESPPCHLPHNDLRLALCSSDATVDKTVDRLSCVTGTEGNYRQVASRFLSRFAVDRPQWSASPSVIIIRGLGVRVSPMPLCKFPSPMAFAGVAQDFTTPFHYSLLRPVVGTVEATLTESAAMLASPSNKPTFT